MDKKAAIKGFRFSMFEMMILIVGIVLTYFGLRVVAFLYTQDGQMMTWQMMITVFGWLTLLVLFILLSMGVDANRRQLEEIKLLKEIIKEEIMETKLMKEEIRVITKKKKS